MADAIHAAAASLKRFALVGVSMGGYALFAYWRKYRHEGKVAGLVFADTKETADSPEAKVDRNGVITLVEAQGVSALATRMLPRLVSPNAEEGARRELRTLMESQRSATVIAATEALRDRPDSSDLLSTIDVPSLVIGGELDVVTPPGVMASMASKMSTARHHVVPAAGHLPGWERPTEFNRAVFSFLESLPLPV
jgi:pimeloyl-ACP methyl ester carboxylesterase